MTNTQKKIQKSSHLMKLLSLCFFVVPLREIAQKLIVALGLLAGNDSLLHQLSQEVPNVNAFHVVAYNFACILCFGFIFTAYYLVHCIFRDISHEYTPFRPLHVKRLRWISFLFVIAFVCEFFIEHWGRLMLTGVLDWTFRLETRYILPLMIFSFSFILDYACQLQAEADTTL